MAECFVLGAGFTKSFSDQAPLMCDFLEKANAKEYFKPKAEHQLLFSIIQRYYRRFEDLSIEDLATFLTRNTSTYWNKEDCNEAFKQLIDIIVRYLGANVNSPLAIDNSINKDKFLKFANYIVKNKTDVISFNYDIVLDELLYRTHEWWVVDGYGEILPYLQPSNPGRIEMNAMSTTVMLEFAQRQHAQKGIVYDDQQAPYLASSAMKLLKLHGSVNWITKETPEIDGRKLTYVQPPCFDHLMAQPIYYEPITGFPMQHVIIPPLLVKTVFYENPLVKRMWQIARLVLEKANKIHIIGYSFPESDFPVRHLFLEAFADPMLNATGKRKILFVNRSDKHAKRVENFFTTFTNCEFEFVQQNAEDYIIRFI